MKKQMFALFAVFAAVFFASCEVDAAIFELIADEVKPKPALIKGSLSQIVKYDNKLYVANGSLWEFSNATGDGSWRKIPNTQGVRDVAATTNALYVVRVDSYGALYKVTNADNGAMEAVTLGGNCTGIAGAGDTLFVGIGVENNYSVSYITGGGTSANTLSGVSDKLNGAAKAGSSYYVAANDGLWKYDSLSGSGTKVTGIDGASGVVAMGSNAAAVSGGALYEISGTTATNRGSQSYKLMGNFYYDGATLYAGSYRGYREINSAWDWSTPDVPSYNSTIGAGCVVSIYKVSNSLIFASVLSSEAKRSGLMSYRDGRWNMEE